MAPREKATAAAAKPKPKEKSKAAPKPKDAASLTQFMRKIKAEEKTDAKGAEADDNQNVLVVAYGDDVPSAQADPPAEQQVYEDGMPDPRRTSRAHMYVFKKYFQTF